MTIGSFAAVVCAVILLAGARSPAPRGARLREASAAEITGRGAAGAPGEPPPAGHGSVAALLVDLGAIERTESAQAVARAVAVAGVALGAALGGALAALLALGAALATPAVARKVLKLRNDDRRDAQLPQMLDRLASSLRGGTSLGQALVAAAEATPEPLGADLRSISTMVEHGAGVPAALRGWSDRSSASPQVRHVAASLSLAAEVGGPVARSVDRVAATLRERRELRDEARALATQSRASAAVLALAPVGFAVLVAAVEPSALSFLFSSPIGLACLTSGLLLEAVGAFWMARMLRSVG